MRKQSITDITKKGIMMLMIDEFGLSFFCKYAKNYADLHNIRFNWGILNIDGIKRLDLMGGIGEKFLLLKDADFKEFIVFILNKKQDISESLIFSINAKLKRDGFLLNKEGNSYKISELKKGKMFLKMYKRYSYDNITNIEFPCMVFVANREWNDYGMHNLFRAFYYDTENSSMDLGYVKILDILHDNSISSLPDEFSELDDNFFTLFQDEGAYQKIVEYISGTYDVYTQLNDIYGNSSLQSKIKNTKGYVSSLIREASAYALIEKSKKKSQSFKFSNLNFDGDSINFDFDYNEVLPYRVNVLIGENGVGKTTTLSKIAETLIDFKKHSNYYDHRPNFSKIITISYSMFDNFIPQEGTLSYTYCGFKDKNGNNNLFFNLGDKLEKNVKLIEEKQQKDIWLSFLLDFLGGDFDVNHLNLDELSSGQQILVAIFSDILASIQDKSLLLFDEPETHLHPNVLYKLIQNLYSILDIYNSYMIVGTHSPIVLQQIPKRYVHVLGKSSGIRDVRMPTFETFGENLAIITREVFGNYESNDILYKKIIKRLRSENMSVEKISMAFDGNLSLNVSILLDSEHDTNGV